MTLISETQERLLVAIGAQVPAERIAEIHFFAPIKQGGVESGVAVVAADAVGVDTTAEETAPEASADDEVPRPSPTASHPTRLIIYTARYRLTLKGPDRGKWETNIVAEADAPLVTVDAVVRGVQRRSGDVDDPMKMEGDEVRTILDAKKAAAESGA